MTRNGMLLYGLALAALTLLGGYLLLLLAFFGAMGIYDTLSKREYLGSLFFVIMWLVFAGFEFLLARKTIRTLRRWWEQA